MSGHADRDVTEEPRQRLDLTLAEERLAAATDHATAGNRRPRVWRAL